MPPSAAALVDRAAQSSGAALPDGMRGTFEQSLGADLGDVRVHTGAASAEAAASVQARAYTVGRDVHFGAGQYQPDDPFGMHLIAHEVAHTQQAGGGSAAASELEMSSPGDASEHDADRAAERMTAGQPTTIESGGGGLSRKLQRSEERDVPTAAASPGAPTVDAKTQKQVEDEVATETRRLAGNRIRSANGEYKEGANNVKAELLAKKAEGTFVDALIEFAVGMAMPGVAAIALGHIKSALKPVADAAITKVVKDPWEQVAKAAYADQLIEKVTVDGGTAKAGYKKVSDFLKAQAQSQRPTDENNGIQLRGGDGKPMSVSSLIDHFKHQFLLKIDALDMSLGNFAAEDLTGVVVAYAPSFASSSIFRSHVEQLVTQHQKLDEDAHDATDKRRVVMLEAWGVCRPAVITSVAAVPLAARGHWKFERWVEEEMIPTATAAAKARKSGGSARAGEPYEDGIPIQGHIDRPGNEEARTVETTLNGAPHLCRAKCYDDGRAEFVSWVEPRDEAHARVQAAAHGGIKKVDYKSFVKSPPMPPPS